MFPHVAGFARLRNVALLVTAGGWAVFLAMANGSGNGHAILNHDFPAADAPGTPTVTGAATWLVMVVAMMMPALIMPLEYLERRSFRSRRWRSSLAFVSGYMGVWMAAGLVLHVAAAAITGRAHPSILTALVAFVVTAVWQCSPAKQRCLNRCHTRPALAAFGTAADASAFRFGVVHGGWCVGSCWLLMMLPTFVPSGHVPVMAANAVLVLCERLEYPAPASWRWRGVRRVTSALAARVQVRRQPARAWPLLT